MESLKDLLFQLKNSSDYMDYVAHMDQQNDRFNNLSEESKLIAYYLMINNKIDDLYKALGEIIFTKVPVSIQEFIESPEYFGNVVNKTLRPRWRIELYRFFDKGSPFKSAIFSGAIGTGKTTISRIMILYVLYRVLCLRNPQATFNLSAESLLCVALISITKDKALKVSFRPLIELLMQCPAFDKVKSLTALNRYKGSKIPFYVVDSDATATFRNNISIVTASQLSHLVGFNTFAGFFDEAELSSSNAEETIETYTELTTRIYSRFKRSGFTFSSIVSSAGTSNGVVQQYIERVKDRIDVDTSLYEYTLWELFPDVDPFAQGSFYVLNGNNTTPSAIIENPNPYLNGEKLIPQNCELIRIPLEYYTQFKTDVVKNLRDIAGRVTNESDVPFPDLTNIYDSSLCPTINIDTHKEDPIPFIDRLPESLFFRDHQNNRVLKRSPRAFRYSHIDLAVVAGSTAAISICHKERGPGNSVIYVTDFIVSIKTIDVINFERIYEFFRDLKYKLGILFKTVSADQFQSVHLLQRIEESGFAQKVQKLSLDVNANPFRMVSSFVSQNCVKVGDAKELEGQLKAVQIDPFKNKRIKGIIFCLV